MRVMTLAEVRAESLYYLMTGDDEADICSLVDVEDMGWCKDGETRWYRFTDENGEQAVYYKY